MTAGHAVRATASAAINKAITAARSADDQGASLLLGMALTGSPITSCDQLGCACHTAAAVTSWQPVAPPGLASSPTQPGRSTP